MQRFVDKLTQYCLKEEIIHSEDVSWFRYSLEKRISTVLAGIPFLTPAFVISNFLCAVSFFAISLSGNLLVDITPKPSGDVLPFL